MPPTAGPWGTFQIQSTAEGMLCQSQGIPLLAGAICPEVQQSRRLENLSLQPFQQISLIFLSISPVFALFGGPVVWYTHLGWLWLPGGLILSSSRQCPSSLRSVLCSEVTLVGISIASIFRFGVHMATSPSFDPPCLHVRREFKQSRQNILVMDFIHCAVSQLVCWGHSHLNYWHMKAEVCYFVTLLCLFHLSCFIVEHLSILRIPLYDVFE